MSLYVKDERLTSPIQPATRRDRLGADGWEKHEACEGTGIENNCRWANEGWANEGLGHECDGCTCPDCAHGLVPPPGMVEAAGFVLHCDEEGRRSKPTYMKLARAALVAAARWEPENG